MRQFDPNMNAVIASEHSEFELDVTHLPPHTRHPLIFSRWSALSPADALILRNDHDPLPLYDQFAAEHRGEFHWEYLCRGPAAWAVRLRRSHYADPGHVPFRGPSPAVASIEFADLTHLAQADPNVTHSRYNPTCD
jgi:uncharacterized protein (DUF2249 family)